MRREHLTKQEGHFAGLNKSSHNRRCGNFRMRVRSEIRISSIKSLSHVSGHVGQCTHSQLFTWRMEHSMSRKRNSERTRRRKANRRRKTRSTDAGQAPLIERMIDSARNPSNPEELVPIELIAAGTADSPDGRQTLEQAVAALRQLGIPIRAMSVVGRTVPAVRRGDMARLFELIPASPISHGRVRAGNG